MTSFPVLEVRDSYDVTNQRSRPYFLATIRTVKEPAFQRRGGGFFRTVNRNELRDEVGNQNPSKSSERFNNYMAEGFCPMGSSIRNARGDSAGLGKTTKELCDF